MKALRFLFSATIAAFALAGGLSAQAQPVPQASTSSTAIDDKARELFRDGVKAAEKAQWAKAHAAFLAAWSLKQHYQIAGNLGTAEAKLGKWRDAAEHLSLYLREAPKEKVAERKSAEELLAQARAKVGALTVRVEPAGAEVVVDGKVVGKAPLAGEVFVEPGARVIEAKLAGFEAAKKDVTAGAGAAQDVEIRLAPLQKNESGEPRKLWGSPEERKGVEAGQPSKSAQGDTSQTKPDAGSDDEATGPRKALIIAGAATSATLVGAGVVFAIVSSVNASDAKALREGLIAKGDPALCLGQAPSQECTDADQHLAARDTFRDLAIWSFVAGGVVGVGTAVYAYVAPRPKSVNQVRVLPAPTARGGGVVIAGEW
jgi:hypothetical protein